MQNIWLDIAKQRRLVELLNTTHDTTLYDFLFYLDSKLWSYIYNHRFVTFSNKEEWELLSFDSIPRVGIDAGGDLWFGLQPGNLKDDCIESDCRMIGLMLKSQSILTEEKQDIFDD